MATLHIENTVRDFESWKAAFDRFDAFRAEKGVRSYRISRTAAEPKQVTVDLDFDSVELAEEFKPHLARIWRTPQSQDLLVHHTEPRLLEVLIEKSY